MSRRATPMLRYLPRLILAVFVVVPLMMLLVPSVQLAFRGLEGPHGDDPLWIHFLGMMGFYGAYALLAASFVSLLHTWWVRRRPAAGAGRQVLWAMVLGVVALLPQAIVFGAEYWLINIAAGITGGGIYGVLPLLLKRPPLDSLRRPA